MDAAPPADAAANGEAQVGQAAPDREVEASTGREVTTSATAPAATTTPRQPVAPVPAPVETTTASGLAIPHHGVGTGVVNHQLIGEADRFAEGSRVWYWTWVQGATPGQTIQHVWLHEGQEKLTVPLKLGGVRWRTQSYKNLHPGLTGQWRVEARDEAGRVLASRDFQCY